MGTRARSLQATFDLPSRASHVASMVATRDLTKMHRKHLEPTNAAYILCFLLHVSFYVSSKLNRSHGNFRIMSILFDWESREESGFRGAP